MLDEEAEPPEPLAAAEPPLVLPLLEAAPPLIPPLLEAEPPVVPPVAPALPVSVLALEPGVLGVVLAEDEDEPPGTTTVSRFSVVDEDAAPLGLVPGTTVVSLRSHAESANAPMTNNNKPLRFMFTLLSSDVVKAPPPRQAPYLCITPRTPAQRRSSAIARTISSR